jgi:hypothetical protein
LQRRRAVPVDGGAWQEVEAELDGDDPRQVESGFAAGLAAAQHQVVDLVRIQRGDLVEGGAHDLDGQVIGAHVDQRPLHRAADRRASS